VSLRKRVEVETTYKVRCSYCGAASSTIALLSLDDAARFFEQSGWRPHPRSILAVLCHRCATLYPDYCAMDFDIENEGPF